MLSGPAVIIGALFVAIGIGVLSDARAEEGNRLLAAQIAIVRATHACFTEAVRVTGYLVARTQAVVNLTQADRVVDVLAHEGDRVVSDQTLAHVERQTVDPRSAGGSKTDTVALKAPAAGVIIASAASVGSTLLPPSLRRTPLFAIAVDGEIELEAEVPSIHVPELSPGQRARVEVRGMRELSGRVRLVPASINQKTQLGYARISVESDPDLRFGIFASASVDAKRSCGVSVPNAAIAYRTGGTSVQVVRDGVVETRSIQVGIHSDVDTEVRNGVNEGDLIVANAGTSLHDGDRVAPMEGDPTNAK